jgi:hypothetical protein
MRTSKSAFKKNFNLLFYTLKRKLKNKFEDFTKQEPMMKAEAVEKTLYLLRRDFDMADQNDIVITLVKRLHDRREADLIKLQEQMDMMKKQSERLKEKVVLNLNNL